MLPISSHTREEWTDTDFDLPEGDAIIIRNPELDAAGDNWDFDLSDDAVSTLKAIPPTTTPEGDYEPSTIKANTYSQSSPAVDDDLEAAFAIPPGLSQLSLRPLNHRLSRTSLEWSDREQTTSSSCASLTSSDTFTDTFTSLGITQAISSTSASSQSTPAFVTDLEPSDELDGLVLPSTIFDSKSASQQLTRILESKKNSMQPYSQVVPELPEAHDMDFESGLVINNDMDFSPGRLPQNRIRRRQQALRVRNGTPLADSQTVSDRPQSPLKQSIFTYKSMAALQAVSHQGATCNYNAIHDSSKIRTQSSLLPLQGTGVRRKLKRKISLPSFQSRSGDTHSDQKQAVENVNISYNSSTISSRSKSHFKSVSRSSHRSTDYPQSTTTLRTSPPPPGSGLTLPSFSSRSRIRPALSSIFSPNPSLPSFSRFSSPSPNSTTGKITDQLATRSSNAMSNSPTSTSHRIQSSVLMRKPKRCRQYGDGTELDNIEDLQIDHDQERRFYIVPLPLTHRVPGASYSPSSTLSKSSVQIRASPENLDSNRGKLQTSIIRRSKKVTGGRNRPTLIRNLNGIGSTKVVGEMRWNPQSLKWDGNEQILRDFDALTGNSTRPALITPFNSTNLGTSGIRIVGNMVFDPEQMRWLPRESAEDEEPDPFAGIEDDEDASSQQSILRSSNSNGSTCSHTNSRQISTQCDKSLRSADPAFQDDCFHTEKTHWQEMIGWVVTDLNLRTRLDYIRELATKKY